MVSLDFIKPKQPLVWTNVIFMALLYSLAPYWLLVYCTQFHFLTWMWIIFCFSVSIFGTTAGVHRLWSHRCYEVNTPLKIVLLMCYSMSGQFTVRDWVCYHRVHHKFSDTDADPHNIKRGFFFAHVGWLMLKDHPDVRVQMAKIDMSDIEKDPYIAFHDRYFPWCKIMFTYVIPILIPVYFWQETFFLSFAANWIRLFSNSNMTWCVNSAGHYWGERPYNKNIQPVNMKLINLLVFGECHHNYHHQFPWDYKAAELGNFFFNVTTTLLEIFNKFGWVYNMKSASPSLIARTVKRHGDGTHPLHKMGMFKDDENEMKAENSENTNNDVTKTENIVYQTVTPQPSQ